MLGPWSDVGRMHRDWAQIDVRCDGTPAPRLIGFDGDDPLVTVMLRPFDRGQAMGPVIEALAFLVPFGANRISAGLPGRGWSMNDPIPPVSDEVDMRQRVIAEMRVIEDGTVSSCLHPFEVDGASIRFDDPVDVGVPEGEIAQALAITMKHRHDLRVGPAEVVEQFARIGMRGHEVAVAPSGADRLERLVLDADPLGIDWALHLGG